MTVGQVFGRWTVLELPIPRNGRTFAMCRCSCGLRKFVDVKTLRGGRSKGCRSCHEGTRSETAQRRPRQVDGTFARRAA